MEEKLFYRLINHEIEWLRYYSERNSKLALNQESDIYKDLKPMGYSKTQMPLDYRCCPGLITSDNIITKETKIEELRQCEFPRGNNTYSPLESFFILFPERKMEMLNKLIPEPHPWDDPDYYTKNNKLLKK